MRRIEFVAPGEDSLVQAALAGVARGARRFRLRTTDPISRAVAAALTARLPGVVIEEIEAGRTDPDPGAAHHGDTPVTILSEADGERLTTALMEFVDAPDADLIAPITNHHWNRRSLFLISIPKSGTHLLTELVAAFGYQEGGECPATDPLPGAWHFLEFTNSHTTAPDFFIDSVRRAPHGNRLHPFPFHPAVFIYRNPLDIVTSEANYYHKDGATTFAGYLGHLNDEQRLLRLIDDPQLLGSIRDRMFKFAAWLDFCNVIPLSYEELVGTKGNGSPEAQEAAIWSLMLKLHVSGNPADIADRVYNPKSRTFGTGKIGGHQQRFTPAAWEKFNALPKDFMGTFGFAERPAGGPWLPSRAAEFRRRIPTYSHADPGEMAIIVRRNFLGHNIYRLRSKFYAVPTNAKPAEAAEQAALLEANDQATVEYLVHSKLFLESTGLAAILEQVSQRRR